MSPLNQALNNLSLDGQPLVQARRTALDDLIINGLTNNEIRYLRARLGGERFRFTKDICGELPVELLLGVAKHLELEDILRARDVSHKWKCQFSSPDFCVGIIKNRFGGTWDRNYNRSMKDLGEIRAEKERLSNWLPSAIKHRLKWKYGKYHQPSHFYYHSLEGTSSPSDKHQYCNGRVAFREDQGIIVKSLDGSAAIKFIDRDRHELQDWLLSDQYLIAKKANSFTILAWPLSGPDARNGSCYQITVHTRVSQISAYGSQVGLITGSSDILVWNIQGQVREIKISRGDLGKPFALLFHPSDKEHFFIFYGYSTGVFVQEFLRGGKQVVICHDLPTNITHPQGHSQSTKYTNEYSSRRNASLSAKTVDTDGWCGIIWDQSSLPDGREFMLRFNLYTQEFSHCLFDFSNIHDNLVSLPNVITQCFLWGDYLLVPDLPSCSKNMRPENALLVVRDIRSSSDDVLTSFWTATEECHEDGIWGRRTYGSERDRCIQGDDNYVVMFGDSGYVVWTSTSELTDIYRQIAQQHSSK